MIERANALLALATFAVISSVTPGPNNFMVMASSAAFGWQRTVPHIAGIVVGFAIMIGSVVLGLGVVLETYPGVVTVVQLAGAAWLFWLAWQLCRTAFGRTRHKFADDKGRVGPVDDGAHGGSDRADCDFDCGRTTVFPAEPVSLRPVAQTSFGLHS